MHGCGNDFVMIDGVTQTVKLTPEKVRQLADRHFGIGCDQLLIVEAPTRDDMDFYYRIYNNDGNLVEHCGNGARCFAKFVRDRKLTAKSIINVETSNRHLQLRVQKDGRVTVDMGAPVFTPVDIPFNVAQQSDDACYQVGVDNEMLTLSALSVGNPHAVLVVDSIEHAPVHDLGARIQAQRQHFPEGVNVGFMQVLSPTEINLRVLERGAGETLACGTGACAAVVAGRMRNLLDETVTVNLLGGTLSIAWAGGDSPVLKTGPATTVFHGQIRL
jgi:diaminopimelate epimerase